MAKNQLTVADLIADHFSGTFNVHTIGGFAVKVTNDPDYQSDRFTVVAVGTRKSGEPLFANKDLKLTKIRLVLTANGPRLAPTGQMTALMDIAGITFGVTVSLSEDVESFQLQASSRRASTVAAVADALSSKAVALPPGLGSVRLRNFVATITAGQAPKASLEAAVGSKWQVPIAGRRLPTGGDGRFRIDSDWNNKKGRLSLSDARVEVDLALTQVCKLDLTYAIGRRLRELTGTWSAPENTRLNWPDLCRALGIEAPKVSVPDALTFTCIDLTLDFTQGAMQMTGRNADGQQVFSRVEHFGDGTWGLAMGVAMPPGWRLEELSSDLKDVDFLEFAQAFVAVASESTKIKAGDFAALGEHEFSLARGLNFAAEIELDKTQASPLAKTLYAVLGRQGFLLSGSVGPRATDDSFSASLPSADIRIPIPPWDGVHAASELVLGQPAITIRPAPLFVAVSGHIEIPVKRGKDIDLQGAVAIGVDQLDISGNLDVSSLAPPSDAQGVELDNVGLSMGVAPEGVTAAFAGDMLVGKARSDDEFSFELAFPEFDPVFLYARFTGVNLGAFFKALCKDGDLPSAFSRGVRFDDILLYWCGDQGGCRLPDKQQTLLQTGFAIHGRVNLFGFHADGQLDVSDSRMSGDLFMDRIRIPGRGPAVFSLTDVSGKQGPHVDFSTDGGGRLDLNYRFDLLGVREKAGLDFDAGRFSLTHTLAIRSGYSATVRFSFDARLRFSLTLSGKFKKRPLSYGHVHITMLSVGFDSRRMQFEASVDGYYGALHLPLPHSSATVTLHEIGWRIEKLIETIAQKLY